MGDPNQSLLQYQDAGVQLPSYADPFAPPPRGVSPPPIPPPIATQQVPPPPPEQMREILDQKISGGQKTLDPTLWLNSQQKKEEPAAPTKSGEPKKKSLSALEQRVMENEAAAQNEQKLSGDERVSLYKGLKQGRVVGPTEQQLEMAATNEKMADSLEAEALNREGKNEFDADAEIRRKLAYADFQTKQAEAMEKRQARINSELDDRFAKVDAMNEAGTEHFWKSREAGARARALDAIGGWRASNDLQAVFMHNAGGQGHSNAVFDMYKQAIDQDVDIQMKNRDFASKQLKERIALLGSREAAEMSLKKEKFDALAKQYDAYAAQSKTLEAKADNEVIARKAMAAAQGLNASTYELTKAHVEQGVNMEFYLRHQKDIQDNPDVLDAVDPAFAKKMLAGEKVRAEVGKLNADTQKAQAEIDGDSSKDAAELANRLQKAKVPENKPLMNRLERIVAQGEDAPGMGFFSNKIAPITKEAAANQRDFHAAVNENVHRLFAGNLTANEIPRAEKAIYGKLSTAASRIQFMKKEIEAQKEVENTIRSGFSKKVSDMQERNAKRFRETGEVP